MGLELLEKIRQSYEGIEVIKQAMVKVIEERKKNPKNTVLYNYKLKMLGLKLQTLSLNVLTIPKTQLDDCDQETKKVEELGLPQLFKQFHDEHKANKAYSKTNGLDKVEADNFNIEYYQKEVEKALKENPSFTEIEMNGRSLDLQPFYTLYHNKKSLQEAKLNDYLIFVRDIESIVRLPSSYKLKHSRDFILFYDKIGNYLVDYHKRIHPLVSVIKTYDNIVEEFETKYKNKELMDYFKDGDEEEENKYCQPCNKSFVNSNTYKNHLQGKKHKKNAQRLAISRLEGEEPEMKPEAQAKTDHTLTNRYMLSRAEYIFIAYKELLDSQFEQTLNLIRQKQTLNADEFEENEAYMPDNEHSFEEEEDAPKTYKQRKLPIGMDGKPIPMWVYKLHGLDREFKCEICGNYSYWGRQAFEKHFTEWRHNYGMKCLKIPNTTHFREITSINDALALHRKLINDSTTHHFNADREAEFEDSEGNVLTKRAYEDLKRENLL